MAGGIGGLPPVPPFDCALPPVPPQGITAIYDGFNNRIVLNSAAPIFGDAYYVDYVGSNGSGSVPNSQISVQSPNQLWIQGAYESVMGPNDLSSITVNDINGIPLGTQTGSTDVSTTEALAFFQTQGYVVNENSGSSPTYPPEAGENVPSIQVYGVNLDTADGFEVGTDAGTRYLHYGADAAWFKNITSTQVSIIEPFSERGTLLYGHQVGNLAPIDASDQQITGPPAIANIIEFADIATLGRRSDEPNTFEVTYNHPMLTVNEHVSIAQQSPGFVAINLWNPNGSNPGANPPGINVVQWDESGIIVENITGLDAINVQIVNVMNMNDYSISYATSGDPIPDIVPPLHFIVTYDDSGDRISVTALDANNDPIPNFFDNLNQVNYEGSNGNGAIMPGAWVTFGESVTIYDISTRVNAPTDLTRLDFFDAVSTLFGTWTGLQHIDAVTPAPVVTSASSPDPNRVAIFGTDFKGDVDSVRFIGNPSTDQTYYDPTGPNAGFNAPGVSASFTDTFIDINADSLGGVNINEIRLRNEDYADLVTTTDFDFTVGMPPATVTSVESLSDDTVSINGTSLLLAGMFDMKRFSNGSFKVYDPTLYPGLADPDITIVTWTDTLVEFTTAGKQQGQILVSLDVYDRQLPNPSPHQTYDFPGQVPIMGGGVPEITAASSPSVGVLRIEGTNLFQFGVFDIWTSTSMIQAVNVPFYGPSYESGVVFDTLTDNVIELSIPGVLNSGDVVEEIRLYDNAIYDPYANFIQNFNATDFPIQ